jgi:hypothetical protein
VTRFPAYSDFPEILAQAVENKSVDPALGIRVSVACREDVTQGKLWAYGDPKRRLSKRKKDELDLIRLAEAYPDLKSRYPSELLAQIADKLRRCHSCRDTLGLKNWSAAWPRLGVCGKNRSLAVAAR